MPDRDASCYIIAGHYGSGKTEIADNLAIRFAKAGRRTAIADLDIVNPFFRTRECKELLGSYGIEVFSSNFSSETKEDTPALAPEIASCFVKSDRVNIVDVGGDPVGAKVLGRYRTYMDDAYEMWMVVNGNRYYTGTAMASLEFLKNIEQSSGLKFTGLINNTHSCEDSTAEDVRRGNELVKELSHISGLPIIVNCFAEELETEVEALKLQGDKMKLKLMHRPKWMKY